MSRDYMAAMWIPRENMTCLVALRGERGLVPQRRERFSSSEERERGLVPQRRERFSSSEEREV